MTTSEQAADKIINDCMRIKKGERILIITDKNMKKVSKALYQAANKVTQTYLIDIPVGKTHGEEPPKMVAEEMKKYDVILIATTKSLSHTKARRGATKAGARIASMPGITEDMMKRAIDVDYKVMAERGNKLRNALTKGKEVKIITELGTDITMSIKGRKAKGGEGGMIHKKGEWDNLPAGESCIAPVEDTANGIFIADASFSSIGRLKKPIKIIVKNGFAANIFGGKEAEKLKKILADVHDKNAFNIAELGIGTNDKAKISGHVLEDEKVLGTAHIALGNSKSLGGIIDVPIHLDGVFSKPTIYVDGKIIIKKGKLL